MSIGTLGSVDKTNGVAKTNDNIYCLFIELLGAPNYRFRNRNSIIMSTDVINIIDLEPNPIIEIKTGTFPFLLSDWYRNR